VFITQIFYNNPLSKLLLQTASQIAC